MLQLFQWGGSENSKTKQNQAKQKNKQTSGNSHTSIRIFCDREILAGSWISP